MTKDKVDLLNIRIDNLTKVELLESLTDGLVLTPNIDHVVKLQKDKEFYHIYKNAEYVVLDSRVLRTLMFLTGKKIKEAIPGSDFFPLFCDYHKLNDQVKIFILGAKHPGALVAMNNINEKTNSNVIVGAHSPSFGFEKDSAENDIVIDMINNSGATTLAVGLGAPKQEKWVAQNRDKMPKVKIFLCIGASIDFEAETIQRAPRILQLLALEWLFRLLKEPKRMIKRYIGEDLAFFRYYLKQLFGTYKNPFE